MKSSPPAAAWQDEARRIAAAIRRRALEHTIKNNGGYLSQAAGIAFARKRRGEKGRVWVFMSDGEFQIGQVWEAFQTLAFHHLDNLAVYGRDVAFLMSSNLHRAGPDLTDTVERFREQLESL